MTEPELRRQIVAALRRMNDLGINQGTSGNISVRRGENMLISPSGIPYETMRPNDLALMPLTGEGGAWTGPYEPSSEWRFHLDILRARREVNAVVHCHATFATVLAIARKDIPACHYMIAAFGGNDVRCAGYATFGTQELAELVLKALEGRTACLLANHGMIATGTSLAQAMWAAVELEAIARQYYLSLLIGGPHLLSEVQVAETAKKFASCGPKEHPPRTNAAS